MFRCNFNQSEYYFPPMTMGCIESRWTVDEITPNSVVLKNFCYTGHGKSKYEYIEIKIIANDVLDFETRNAPIRKGTLKRSKWDLRDLLKGL